MRGLGLPRLLGEVRFLQESVGDLMTEARARYRITALTGGRSQAKASSTVCLEAQMPGCGILHPFAGSSYFCDWKTQA